jgi:hypothetical protein
VALPVPLVAESTSSQLALLDAVHAQSAVVVSVN